MFSIDQNICIRCGSCVRACPANIFTQAEDGTVSAQQKECLNCFHCAAACPVKAISHDELDHDACYPSPAAPGSLLEKFQQRHSIRHYSEETLDKELIRAALDGAACAPSAKNQQLSKWTVVLGKEQVEEICRLSLEWANGERDYRHLVWLHRHGHNPITCNAPGLVIIHAPTDCHYPNTDAVIAMTLAEQLLVDSGLGTCWGGYLCRIINHCSELKAALSLPEGHEVYGVLMVGKPDERYVNVPYRKNADIHWVE